MPEDEPVAHLLTWPKRRPLTTDDGVTIVAVVQPGRLRIETPSGLVLDCADPDELRAFAMQMYAATLDHDQGVQHAAAKASADRRQRRILAGGHAGHRHQPFTDPPEPPIHADLETA